MKELLNILNNNISVMFLSIIFTTLVTITFIEEKKRLDKRKQLLIILKYELDFYSPPSNTNSGLNYRTPHRDKLIWSILQYDVLHPKKDKELINNLYNLLGYIENYNAANNNFNQALLLNNEELIKFFGEGRDILYNKSWKEKEKLTKLLINKYKIN